jgi:hypothetical protein
LLSLLCVSAFGCSAQFIYIMMQYNLHASRWSGRMGLLWACTQHASVPTVLPPCAQEEEGDQQRHSGGHTEPLTAATRVGSRTSALPVEAVATKQQQYQQQ